MLYVCIYYTVTVHAIHGTEKANMGNALTIIAIQINIMGADQLDKTDWIKTDKEINVSFTFPSRYVPCIMYWHLLQTSFHLNFWQSWSNGFLCRKKNRIENTTGCCVQLNSLYIAFIQSCYKLIVSKISSMSFGKMHMWYWMMMMTTSSSLHFPFSITLLLSLFCFLFPSFVFSHYVLYLSFVCGWHWGNKMD